VEADMRLKTATFFASAALLYCLVPVTARAQQTPPPPPQEDPTKKQKVWTNDDLKRLPDSVTVTGESATQGNTAPQNSADQNATNQNGSEKHYEQSQDPTWYEKQLAPLRQELDQIDQQLNAIRQAQKDGRGASNAVSLEKVPAGVDTEGEVEVLRQRRAEVASKIDDIESEARRNGVLPGDLRKEPPTEEAANQPTAGTEQENAAAEKNPEVVKAKNAVAEGEAQLQREKKELDLLQRELNLDQQTVYSNPNYLTTGSGDSQLDATRAQIDQKQAEIEQTERKLAELKEHLEDLERNPPTEVARKEEEAPAAAPAPKQEEEKGEVYWRKRFADLRSDIHLAETELDILQRELNALQLQYDPDPQKALIEQTTRQSINEHQDEIAAKQKEIDDLKQKLADLEDELRRAGGDPGWARE
jgi:chromosome segregation ATPase